MLFTYRTNDPSWRPDASRPYVQMETHDPARHPDYCYGAKPEGLWLSWEGEGMGWKWWASEEMPRKLGSVAKEVRADASRLLVLKGRRGRGSRSATAGRPGGMLAVGVGG